MEDQSEIAKELFMMYLGSLFQMQRDGVLKEYKEFAVTPEVEVEWSKKLIAKHASELSIRDWSALGKLQTIAKLYNDESILNHVVTFASRHIMSSDSIVKLMYAEGLIDLIKSTKQKISNDAIYEAYNLTILILEDIISKPLIIDPGHELRLFQLQDKKSLNNRVKKNMDDIKDYLS